MLSCPGNLDILSSFGKPFIVWIPDTIKNISLKPFITKNKIAPINVYNSSFETLVLGLVLPFFKKINELFNDDFSLHSII